MGKLSPPGFDKQGRHLPCHINKGGRQPGPEQGGTGKISPLGLD